MILKQKKQKVTLDENMLINMIKIKMHLALIVDGLTLFYLSYGKELCPEVREN